MLTTGLAIWGATLSTILAIWNIHKDFRDKGFLRVEAYLSEWDEIDEENDGERIRKYQVEIIITNIGRRSVVAHSLGYGRESNLRQYIWRRFPAYFRLHRKMPAGSYEAIFDVKNELPKKLDSGDFAEVKLEKLLFLEDEDITIFVLDSLGRYFFVPKSALERMKRNYRPEKPEETAEHIFARIRQP